MRDFAALEMLLGALIGLSLMRSKRWEEALSTFTAGAERWPAQPAFQHGRAFALAALGRRAEAITVLQDLIAANPRDVGARLELGRLLQQEGQLDEAAAALEAAVALSPKSGAAYEELGAVYLAQQRREKAIDALEAAVRRCPHASRPYLLLATAYLETMRYEEVISLLQRGLRKVSGEPRFHYYLALAHAVLYNAKAARHHYQVLLKADPELAAKAAPELERLGVPLSTRSPQRLPAMDDYCVYRLKVTLKGIRPPIWRRLAVPGEISLRRLHQTLQTAFGWQDYHLHEFIIDGTVYGLPDREAEMMGFRKVRDDRRVKLKAVVSVRDKFLYRYDLGDNWEHEIQVEDIELGQKQERPVCLGGRRAAPPEDCGGLSGYTDLLDALGDPEHPEHESYVEWLGGVFDPEAFDLAAVNQRLAEIRVAPRSSR